jgi:hypothetical protein
MSGLVSRLLRGALVTGLVTMTAIVGLLVAYAGAGWWPLAIMAMALTPVLWACALAQLVGARVDDPGFREAMRDFAVELREFGDELRAWARNTRRELREAWTDPEYKPNPDRTRTSPQERRRR